MGQLSRVDAVFLAVTAGVWVAVVLQPAPGIDRFFGLVMLTSLLVLLRLGAQAWLSARRADRHADEVVLVGPDEAAARAVEEERERLGADIVRSLRATLVTVGGEVDALEGAATPVPGLRRIQAETRRATSELRRQLGLLRTPEDATASGASDPGHRSRPGRGDVVLALVVAALAAAESAAYLLTEGFGEGAPAGATVPVGVGLSVLAAASIVLRRSDPVVGAVWCAAAFGAGTVLGSPVAGGFWAVATVGSLVWTLTATARAAPRALLAWSLLAAAVVHSRLVGDRDNAFIFALLIGVVTTVGLALRLARRRRDRAVDRARVHEEAVAAATRTAVRRERQQFAREIHDVVSHAVGLVAMQAAAAEVSWPSDPGAVQRAVGVVRATVTATVSEVDRLVPGAAEPAEPSRVEDLVDRIRRSGTVVDLQREGECPAVLAPLVYRVVQEGLTNAVRHAPGAEVVVRVATDERGLSVVVEDDGAARDHRHQPGYGLVGVGERVAMLGGTMAAGPREDGRGFRLLVQVPGVGVGAAR